MNHAHLTVMCRGRAVDLWMLWPTFRVRVVDGGGSVETSYEDAFRESADLARLLGMTAGELRAQLQAWRSMMSRWERSLPPAA